MEHHSSPLAVVVNEISDAAQRSGRASTSIQLVAVTKTISSDVVKAFCTEATSYNLKVVLGENYVQEARQKKAALDTEGVLYSEIHLLGPLQSNKVRDAVGVFDVIQSIHSLKVLRLVAKEAARVAKKQRIFLQVNISDDPAKAGFREDEVEAVVREVVELSEYVALEGLMTITAHREDPEDSRGDFRRMVVLRNRLQDGGLDNCFCCGCIKLSMGMSADFSVAIEEGADLVRVGTALFGERL